MDDKDLTYPPYEKARKHSVRNICVHKGVLLIDYERIPNWHDALLDDLGKAAQDWLDLNFHIYHTGLKVWHGARGASEAFERTGRLPWIDEMAAIPEKHGVSNVYADIGLSFSALAITHPRFAAAMLGDIDQGVRGGWCAVGHRFNLGGFATMADRGIAPHRDSGRLAR